MPSFLALGKSEMWFFVSWSASALQSSQGYMGVEEVSLFWAI